MYLGSNVSFVEHRVGDRLEINGELREVVRVVPCGFDSCGQPQYSVFTRVVSDLSQVPAPARWGLRALARIAGVPTK